MTWLKLEATELDSGSTYEARLRVQMATPEDAVAEEERYEGPWSEWSQPARVHSPQRQGGRCCLQGPGWGLPAPSHPTPYPSWDLLPRGPVDCLPLEVCVKGKHLPGAGPPRELQLPVSLERVWPQLHSRLVLLSLEPGQGLVCLGGWADSCAQRYWKGSRTLVILWMGKARPRGA